MYQRLKVQINTVNHLSQHTFIQKEMQQDNFINSKVMLGHFYLYPKV